MPASRQLRRSLAKVLAVMAKMGMSWSGRLLWRMSRVAVTPSITGICMSMNTAKYSSGAETS